MSIKTAFKTVKTNRPEFRNLINAVVRRVGLDSVSDIVNNGIGGGFGGFIYYHDTCAFFKQYRADILRLLNDTADSLFEKPMQVALSFNCFDEDQETAIGQFVYGGKMTDDETTTVQNGFAWFAAEEVCRWIIDELENMEY